MIVSVSCGSGAECVLGVTSGQVSQAGAEASPTLRLVRDAGSRWLALDRHGREHLLPPFDERMSAFNLVRFPPRLDVSWRWTLYGGPFGDVSVRYRVSGGRLLEVSSIHASQEQPGVSFDLHTPYRRALEFRLGRVTPAEFVLPPATMTGDVAVAMMVEGFIGDGWDASASAPAEILEPLMKLSDELAGRKLTDYLNLQ